MIGAFPGGMPGEQSRGISLLMFRKSHQPFATTHLCVIMAKNGIWGFLGSDSYISEIDCLH